MSPVMLGLVVVAAFYFLTRGAGMLVDGAASLALRLGMSKIIVGATVVALGTTSPEAAVSVLAAWDGRPELALGNAIGSIIADTALIFGLGCLLVALPADRFVLNRHGWMQFAVVVLLAALCYGAFMLHGDAAALGRMVGVVLLVGLVGYLLISVHWSRQHGDGGAEVAVEDAGVDPQRAAHASIGRSVAVLVLGLVVVLVSSRFLILGVSETAVRLGVPNVVIAATLVALGTSLPELATCIAAIIRGHYGLLVGNIIGADILNVLFVVGAAAAAADLAIIEAGSAVPRMLLYLHLPFLLGVIVMFRLFIMHAIRRGSFARWMGVPLVAAYVVYVSLQFILSAA